MPCWRTKIEQRGRKGPSDFDHKIKKAALTFGLLRGDLRPWPSRWLSEPSSAQNGPRRAILLH